MTRLQIQNFAHLENVDIQFGDLTVLVGAQGTGKSLALQWLKTVLDGKHIVSELAKAGDNVRDKALLIDLIFGIGMGAAWTADSLVQLDNKPIGPRNIARQGENQAERVFFIPAHRSMLISDGWAVPFQRLNADTPAVARLFSQNLFDLFSPTRTAALFPMTERLKKLYRDLIDDAVYHGGIVGLVQDEQHKRRLMLSHGPSNGGSRLPFMTWTAGQREFTPLLLGLYYLLPPSRAPKRPEIEWVVIEEPEMGLHPQAISVVILLVLELLWRGYKVVLSTHSPLVLTAVWMLRRLKECSARWQLVCDGFSIPAAQYPFLREVAPAALTKDYRTYVLEFAIADDGKTKVVRSQDISGLDPASDVESEAEWGGLIGFASRFGDTVRRAVLEGEK